MASDPEFRREVAARMMARCVDDLAIPGAVDIRKRDAKARNTTVEAVLAEDAVRLADALVAELAKETSNG